MRSSHSSKGRLFWKFFVLIGLVQLGSIVLIGVWLYVEQHKNMTAIACHPVGLLPLEPIVGGLIASLSSAALVAWLLSKPIRSLRAALTDAAGGNLDACVADSMGRGNDELKELGVEFDRMIGRVRLLVGVQRQLLKDVSHELRSPMARIQAAIGLAHQQPEQVPALMERIQRESVRVDKLIGELLALCRLQSDVDNDMKEEIELHDLLSEIIEDARFEATARGRFIRVVSEIEGIVLGNVELLRRAVENVVRNAIKYSRSGGTVEIGTIRRAEGRVTVISVRDSGTGVPENDLPHIFDPFFRSTSHARTEGSGLGLTIAKRVIESHAGAILARNEASGGLRVDIELPLHVA